VWQEDRDRCVPLVRFVSPLSRHDDRRSRQTTVSAEQHVGVLWVATGPAPDLA